MSTLAGLRAVAIVVLLICSSPAAPGHAAEQPATRAAEQPATRAADQPATRAAEQLATPSGRIVLRPGEIEVRSGGRLQDTVDAPVPLDIAELPRLVDDDELIERMPGGAVVVRVPIDQRDGSRLIIDGRTAPAIDLTGRGRFVGSGALLSVHDATITASGVATGDPHALLGYQDSGIRMSRVRVRDGRGGPGAARAIDLTGGEFRIISGQVTGGSSGVRLDGVRPAELIGVQVERSRGTGLAASGDTRLSLRDVRIAGHQGDGLDLSGRGLTLSATRSVTVQNNGGEGVILKGTRYLELSGVRELPRTERAVTGLGGDLSRQGPVATAQLHLSWLFGTGLALLLGAAALEVIRSRRGSGYQIRTRWAGSK